MTVLLSILGVHLVNVLFIYFTMGFAARRNGMNNAFFNLPYFIFLFRHPFLNLLCLLSIFDLGSNGLDEIIKSKMNKE